MQDYYNKSIVILWICRQLEERNQITTQEIIREFNINNKQVWHYICNLKEFYATFTSKALLYSKKERIYYLKSSPVSVM